MEAEQYDELVRIESDLRDFTDNCNDSEDLVSIIDLLFKAINRALHSLMAKFGKKIRTDTLIFIMKDAPHRYALWSARQLLTLSNDKLVPGLLLEAIRCIPAEGRLIRRQLGEKALRHNGMTPNGLIALAKEMPLLKSDIFEVIALHPDSRRRHLANIVVTMPGSNAAKIAANRIEQGIYSD